MYDNAACRMEFSPAAASAALAAETAHPHPL